MEIIEYNTEFKYEIKDDYLWVDNFKLSDEWEIIRLKKMKIVQKAFMNRSPYIEPTKEYTIAIYAKNKWYILHNGIGKVTTTKKELEIPNLKIIECKFEPLVAIYKYKFDFHIMMIIINLREDVTVLEFKKVAEKEGIIVYNKIKINVYNELFSYRGDKHNIFTTFCEEMIKDYNNNKARIEKLFSIFKKSEHTHKSLAFNIWYKAKRENQQEWPLISNKKQINSIEFPLNSGIYYYHPEKYVGLSKRNDDNEIELIPKIYKTDHSKKENTYLYYYNKTGKVKNDELIKIPHTLRKNEFKHIKKIKILENEKYTEVDYNGEIIETDLKPEYYVYRNIIIQKIKNKIKYEEIEAQLVDENNKRIKTMINGKWENIKGPKIKDVITIPWNYRQIIHDYNKLQRLKEGNITDISNIGIINENSDDIISWPNINDLYISKTIETKRLITFKYQKNTKIQTLYE